MTWQIQEAKNKLSEVIAKAHREGPQTITRHGKEVAVVVAYDQFNGSKPRQSLVKFLLRSPLLGSGINLERDRNEPVRDIEL